MDEIMQRYERVMTLKQAGKFFRNEPAMDNCEIDRMLQDTPTPPR